MANESTTFDADKFKEAMDKLTKQTPHPFEIHPFDTQPTQPHVCPNCGHCPTCGEHKYHRRPLPWEYRPDPYYERFTPGWKWQQPDIVMCVG